MLNPRLVAASTGAFRSHLSQLCISEKFTMAHLQ